MKLSHALLLLVVVATAGLPVRAQQTSAPIAPIDGVSAPIMSKLDAIIEEPDLRIFVPAPRCAVPGMVARVTRSVGIPAGIENAPESCNGARPLAPDAERLTLTGLTAREALNRLTALDPRYQWVESNGVVVLRPLKAWNDRSHFLHRVAPSFRIDAPNYTGALKAVYTALVGWSPGADSESFGGRTPQGSVPIFVHLETATSAYEALNAIVRAHGSMRWRVTYCTQEARLEFATFRMATYDGSAFGSHAAVLKDESGKSYDPCWSKR